MSLGVVVTAVVLALDTTADWEALAEEAASADTPLVFCLPKMFT